jgi:hypothetical protein
MPKSMAIRFSLHLTIPLYQGTIFCNHMKGTYLVQINLSVPHDIDPRDVPKRREGDLQKCD